MPANPNDISGDYLDRRDNTPNDALSRLMAEPSPQAQAGTSAQPREIEELPFTAKYPNLYGMYGAVKEVGKSLLPWIKYIDPEERENFSKLSTQQQTRDLLLEDLNFALMGRWKPIEQAVKSIGGAALETFLPKTYKVLVKPLGAGAKKVAQVAELPPGETPFLTPKKPAGKPVAPKVEPKALAEGVAKIEPPAEVAAPADIPVIDSDDAFKQIQKLANDWDSIIEIQRRGTRTHPQAREEGALLGMTPDDAKAISPGMAMNDGQAAALIDTVNSVATTVHEAARKAVTTGTEEDMQVFLRKFLALGEVDPARWGVRTESGRTLSVMNEPISGINQYLDQFSNALKASETMTPERLAKMVSELKDAGSLAGVARQATKAGPVDMLTEAWINGLLSGPASHAANTSGNIGTILFQPGVRTGAAIIGKVLPGEAEIPLGEGAQMLYGMIGGLRDAFRLTAKAAWEGKPSRGDASKIEWNKAITGENMGFSEGSDIGRAIDFLGEVVRSPGRGLMVEDEFFKAIAYRMELRARAYREGVANGFEKEDLAQFVAEEIRNPSKSINHAAEEFAKYVTFQKDLGTTGQAFQSFVSSHPALKVIFPFVKTPANIFKFAGEMTPLAPFSNAVRADIAKGGATRDLALAKIALGTSLMTTVASYVADGRITGGGPSDPQMRASLMRTGWQPYSLKIGDKYYQYSRIEPIATLLGVAASAAEVSGEVDSEDIDYEKIPSAIIMAVSKNIVDKTFLQGVTKLIEAIEDPDRYGARYVQGLAGTAVPAISAQMTRSIEKDVKAVNSVMDSIKSRIPGYAKDLPQRLDIWGEPITLDTWGPMIVSPVRRSKVKESLADQEIVRNKVDISMPEKRIDGVELTPQEYNRFVELAGRDAKAPNGLGAKEAIEEMVKSPNYERQSDGPDGGKALMLKTQILLYRELARKMMIQELPDLEAKARGKLEKKQANLMPDY